MKAFGWLLVAGGVVGGLMGYVYTYYWAVERFDAYYPQRSAFTNWTAVYLSTAAATLGGILAGILLAALLGTLIRRSR